MTKKIKIGIIQNSPLTADFSNNLRQIVQGYRECLDHGADLIIASAYALCGADPGDLANRDSFRNQTRAALECLSQELGNVPLLMGAYTDMPIFTPDNTDDDVLSDNDELYVETAAHGYIVPYLLEHDCVEELFDAEVIDLDEFSVYIDTHDDGVEVEDATADLIVHLSDKSWYAGQAEDAEKTHRWEADTNGVPVVCVYNVGTSGDILYGGGSAVYSPGNITQARLPFFENAAKVVNTAGPATAKALPTEAELLCQAIKRGITDTVRNNGFTGVCLSMDHEQAPLLAALCTETLGASNVRAFTFRHNIAAAKALGIRCKEADSAELVKKAAEAMEMEANHTMESRMRAAMISTYADEHGLLPITSITRHDLMTGNFTLYGDAGAYLAPLGNLYEMDTHMMRVYLKEKNATLFGTLEEPQHPEEDRIIHELADRNLSAGTLLFETVCPFTETEVRKIQRGIIASAFKRALTPTVLRTDRPEERLNIPTHHRLND